MVTMLKYCMIFLYGFSMTCACSHEGEKNRKHWYTDWLNHPTSLGQLFHSEFLIRSGEKRKVKILSDVNLTIGFYLKNGYDITKDKGTLYMGTMKNPKIVGGSPGVAQEFRPENGEITLILENTSKIDTRLLLYTKNNKAHKK